MRGRNNLSDRLTIHKLSPEDWAKVSETTYLVVFGGQRPSGMDRIDYALVIQDVEQNTPCGYLTARELDSDSVYWQFGGAFPGTHSSSKAVECYKMFVDWTLARYKRITTLVENTNVRYLKLAMHAGFRIIGVRMFDGSVLVELLNKRGEA
jgi:hypothetical protein